MNAVYARIYRLVAVLGGISIYSWSSLCIAGVWTNLYEKMRDPKAPAPTSEVQKWSRDQESKKAALQTPSLVGEKTNSPQRTLRTPSLEKPPSQSSRRKPSFKVGQAAGQPRSPNLPQLQQPRVRAVAPPGSRAGGKQALPGISGEGVPGRVDF